MAKNRTVEDKIMSSHEDRVKGITALAYYVMKEVAKIPAPDSVLYSSARQITETWLESEVDEDEKDGRKS